jgi:endonuclease III
LRYNERMDKKRNDAILKILQSEYFDAKPALEFRNPFELLIATILSAQSTDKQVNKVTKGLFESYSTPFALMNANESDVQHIIKSCGFYKTKGQNIVRTAKILVEEYDSVVPKTIEQLIKMPGVGRKTASVVISNAYDVPAIAVDTHVFRVSNRLGLATAKDVLKTEMQLRKNIPMKDWKDAHHWILWHGRKYCKARKPLCGTCFLSELCVYYKSLTQVDK